MSEFWKRLLKITDPVLPSEPTESERKFDRVSVQTLRTVVRSEAQVARASRVISSWEDLYGRKGKRE